MSEDNFQDASQEMNGLPTVVLGDEGLPRLYEESEISTSQFPRQYGNQLICFFSCIHFLFLTFKSLFLDNYMVVLFFKIFRHCQESCGSWTLPS
jgi:hypothetical protein